MPSPESKAPSPSQRRRRAALRTAELALAAVGGLCLLAYAAACSRSVLFQAEESRAFEQALAQRIHSEAPDTREWSSGRLEAFESQRGVPVRAVARLEIPRAEISVMVLDGTEQSVLDRAVGLVEGTARPGEPGNVGIAGHRDGWFRGLRHLEPGDTLSLTTLAGVARYEVQDTQVVEPTRVEVLDPTPEDVLTLITCYPFYFVGDAPERFVVRARKVEYVAWSQPGARLALQGTE